MALIRLLNRFGVSTSKAMYLTGSSLPFLIDGRYLVRDAVLLLECVQIRRGSDQGHLPKPARLLLPEPGHLFAGADAAADHRLQPRPIIGLRRGILSIQPGKEHRRLREKYIGYPITSGEE